MKRTKLAATIFFVILIAALFAWAGTVALAQEPTLDEVNDVAKEMNCPTCQSLNLADCRTQTCDQWRTQIKDLLASGMSKQEVLDWYISRYGEEVLQEPPTHGVGLYVWILPVIGLVAGAGWLTFILKKWSAGRQAEPAASAEIESPDTDLADDYLQQVEQDLKEL